MRRASPIRWSSGVLVLAAVVAASTTSAMAAQESPAAKSLLTIDRLFGSREFDTEPVPEFHWSERSSTYFTLANAANGPGRDLVRVDPASETREVMVPASAFIPKGSKTPLGVEAFAFSADESRLLIFTNGRRVWRRNTRGDYWVLDVAKGQLRRLGGVAAPSSLMFAQFSPDGFRVAYVHQNNIYVENLHDSTVTALTTDGSKTLINGTGDWVNEEELDLRDGVRWSPDGKDILYWRFDTEGVSEFHLIDNIAGNTPKITTFAYPKVGGRNSATRLGVVSAEGGPTRWFDLPGDPRDHYLPRAEWTPDGSGVLVQRFNRAQTELRVFLADPRTGQARVVMTETDRAWIDNVNSVRWLDGGKRFLWLSERSGWRHAYRVGLDGSPLEPITRGSFDVINIQAVDESEGWLYYDASPDDPIRKSLHRARLDGGGSERITPTDQPGWHDYKFSPNAKWAVHSRSTFTTPPVVELIRFDGPPNRRVLADNGVLRAKLNALERPDAGFFRVEISDGVTLDGWLIKPAKIAPAAKLPLLIYVYGEPAGQTVRDAWPGSAGLWHWMLAQEGFVVASVDNRGTNVPKGRDWRKSVHRRIGVLASGEQAEAVRGLLKRWPFVDPKRVGVWGWSGGGSA